jgi:hypothetical protein
MKNVHVLPTDKPSRLSDCHNNKLHLDNVRYLRSYQNIYITNDELPKIDEWGINVKNNVIYKDKGFVPTGYEEVYCRKIILTTDQDLIKDGVQAIDDEFLEWFVKNPSCEEVEIKEIEVEDYVGFAGHTSYPTFHSEYKIIIPKEEPKKETLEEATEKFYNSNDLKKDCNFIEGAKWQAKTMYSKEEVEEIFKKAQLCSVKSDGVYFKYDSFEKFKKK